MNRLAVSGDLKWFGGWVGGCSFIIAIHSLQQNELAWAIIFIAGVIYSIGLLWFTQNKKEKCVE